MPVYAVFHEHYPEGCAQQYKVAHRTGGNITRCFRLRFNRSDALCRLPSASRELFSSKGPTQAESGSRPPAFDKNGNANYDANGNYIGGHGVGTLVDSPENSAPAPTSPSDLVRKDQADIDDAMCKSMKAADPDAGC